MGFNPARSLRKGVKSVSGSLKSGLGGGIGALTGLAGGLLGGVFGGGGGGSIPNATPNIAGFNSGGLSGQFDKSTNQFNVTRSGGLNSLINNSREIATRTADDISGLRGLVAPGISQIRASRLDAIEGRRRKAIGNLRENLGRRRVLGSSFGADALARTEAEFAREQADIEAETGLLELEQTRELINQEANARLQGIQVALSQLNIESSLGAQLASGATAAVNDMIKFQTQLAFQKSESGKDREAAGLQGIGQLVGLGALALSDRRYKKAIKYIGEWLGERWYEFEYLTGQVKHLGVMAQEASRGVIDHDGVLLVDYEELLWG